MLFQIASIETISKLISHPTWDILVLFFFLAVGFFYGLFAGKKKLLSVLFSIYISILLFSNFNYMDFFVEDKGLFDVFLFRSFAFLGLIIISALLFNRTIFRSMAKKGKWWQSFMLSFLETGLLMSAVFQLLPAKELFEFSPAVKTIFASGGAFFWWLTLPLAALFFILGKSAPGNSTRQSSSLLRRKF